MATEHTLLIKHIPDSEPPRFMVVRQRDGKATMPVEVPSPAHLAVPDTGDSRLLPALRWYLEDFLDYPFPPETERAASVCKALEQWGEAAFAALFGDRAGGRFFDAATSGDYARLRLGISSDSPDILAWPWEALRDPEVGYLAHTCQIERRLNKTRDPAPLSDALPRERIRILLVTARPYEPDVPYRSVSRHVVDVIARDELPADVTVLRPPTFEALRRHLARCPDTYHLLHFDGHGMYLDPAAAGIDPGDAAAMRGAQGCLIFEDEHGAPDPKSAAQLGVLLRDCRIPAVVLNACQSAMISDTTDNVFASVATALLQAGVRNVVAMRYSLYVRAAQVFLPAFYRRLFESGRFAEATRAGRQALLARPERPSARGMFPLQDWLVPVLYEQAAAQPLRFAFAAPASPPEATPGAMFPMPGAPAAPARPAVLEDPDAPAGFVGRDSEILALERALHRAPAGLLVHGPAGIGKTALARAFARWLVDTDGVAADRVLWLRIDDQLRDAMPILDHMGRVLFGEPFLTVGREDKIRALAEVMRAHRFLVVWDQLERLGAAPGAASAPESGNHALLAQLLRALRGGRTKVLLTSRGAEDWLGPQDRFLLGLEGLAGEDRWELAAVLLRNLGQRLNLDDDHLRALIDHLQGHPPSPGPSASHVHAPAGTRETHGPRAPRACSRPPVIATGPARRKSHVERADDHHSTPGKQRPGPVPRDASRGWPGYGRRDHGRVARGLSGGGARQQ